MFSEHTLDDTAHLISGAQLPLVSVLKVHPVLTISQLP